MLKKSNKNSNSTIIARKFLSHLGLELVKLRVMDLHSKIGNYVNIGASSRFICSNYKEGPRFGNYLYFSDDALPIAALQQRE
mmetsp:Transcript_16282/g.44166  ORF Transcript_16282/g.44166 Transcript_16282/m.44166 type:complete len:82 (-) Transcript_16282:2384-2629(-)